MSKKVIGSDLIARPYLYIAIILLSLSLGACHKAAFRFDPQGEKLEHSATRELFLRLTEDPSYQQGFRAMYRARVESDEGRQGFRLIALREPSGRARVEILPINAAYSLALVIRNAQGVFYYDNESKVFSKKDNPEGVIKDLIGIAVSLDEFLSLLIGDIPANYLELEPHALTIDSAQNQFDLIIADKSAGFSIDSKNLLLKRALLRQPFRLRPIANLTYEHEGPYPRQIDVELQEADASISLRRTYFDSREQYPDKLFQIK